MQGDAGAALRAGQPQVVAGHRADLGDLQQRGDEVAQRPDGLQRGDRVGARDQELRLQLVAVARREVHPEVRQAVVPRAGLAQLRGAVHGVDAGQRVAGAVGGGRAEQVGAQRVAGRDAGLAPDLLDGVAGPVGEEAHGVGAAGDLVQVRQRRRPRQVDVDLLRDVVRGLDVEGHAGDHAERAERDDGAGEVVVAAADRPQRAVGSDDLQGGDGRRRGSRSRHPEPCVAVATAPATEMCGRDARLCTAQPAGCRCCASVP